MSKKRLLILATGVIIMASLVGTSIAMDGKSPFEPIWQAIYNLQARVTALEESTNTHPGIKTIRFYEPDETMNDQSYVFVDGAVFVWTPNNSTDNAILSISWYFQYRCEDLMACRIVVNDEPCITHYGYYSSSVYNWTRIFVDAEIGLGNRYPNQNNYTLRFQFFPRLNEFPAYVKDINIIITVADGLPPSN